MLLPMTASDPKHAPIHIAAATATTCITPVATAHTRPHSPRLRFETLDPACTDTHELLATLGKMRLEVFREYPYLYEGTLDYETRYLRTYLKPRARIFLAYDQGEVVGATTCIPMADEEDAFKKPILTAGLNPEEILYLGESVLRSTYRGQGAGVEFFNLRETYARSLPGIRKTMFCAVARPTGDPKRPPGYRQLDAFWAKRGYTRVPGLAAQYEWIELGDTTETQHTMTYWLKDLS